MHDQVRNRMHNWGDQSAVGVGHVKDLHPFRGSHPLNDDGDTEDSMWPIYLELGLPNDLSDISGLPTNPNIPSESSSEEDH